MGFFSRLGTLIRSNINDLISKAEDPEKMLNQVLLDMKTQLVDAKKQVAVSIGDEKRLKKQLDDQLSFVQSWHQKAMLAVQAGDDTLAKEALARQKEHEEMAKQFEDQWRLQKDSVERLKEQLRFLNDKIEEAKRKRNLLVARQKRAEAQRAIQSTMSGLSDTSAFDTFERMAEKIELIEAKAEADAELSVQIEGDSLSQRFKALEGSHGQQVDHALLELKSKMGLLPQSNQADQSKQIAAGDSKGESANVGVETPKEALSDKK